MAQIVGRYINPLLRVLKGLGGSARPQEVYAAIAEEMKLPDDVLDEVKKDGRPVYENQIAWARLYLVKAGYIDKSKRGVWTLTQKGRDSPDFTEQKVESILQEVQRRADAVPHKPDATLISEFESAVQIPEDLEDDTDYRQDLLNVLKSLSPSGFERLCQRLLRESGFDQVVVTGRSGDGGIDGFGVLKINSFVKLRAHFQCKRYSKSVGAPQIRDFRGAIAGRGEKGIIITTGTFTADAQREATRDGTTPIELIDGFQLVELFEEFELGSTPRQTFDVDASFFDEFR